MRNIAENICNGNQNIHFMFQKSAVYKIMLRNVVQPDRPQMTIRFDTEEL